MTMLRSFGALAAVGALLLIGAQTARADDDTYRLGGKVDAVTTNLAWDGQDDTVLTRGYRGGFGYGGYRGGYHGGYRGGYYGGGYRVGYGGYYGGYRVGYNHHHHYGYRPYYGVGYYRPYYGYASYSYYAPTYYYSQPYYNYPISCDLTYGGAQTYQPMIVNPGSQQQVLPQEVLPQPYTKPMQPADGTYQYDGGPKAPVPLPKEPMIPSYQQQAPKLIPASDGRLVSLPSNQLKTGSQGGFAYPAYGEQTQPTTFASDRIPLTTVAGKYQK